MWEWKFPVLAQCLSKPSCVANSERKHVSPFVWLLGIQDPLSTRPHACRIWQEGKSHAHVRTPRGWIVGAENTDSWLSGNVSALICPESLQISYTGIYVKTTWVFLHRWYVYHDCIPFYCLCLFSWWTAEGPSGGVLEERGFNWLRAASLAVWLAHTY